jgi:pimeloyl-ACP methyl ester carboxylesterase
MERMGREIFVLISGAWHGSWCWHKLIEPLQTAGHTVLASDLPGCGADGVPPAAVTLEMWTQSVCRILETQPQPVILVGHSRGGIVISQVAERLPQRVKQLVYVSGFLLRAGESVLRVLREEGSSPLLRIASLAADKQSWELDPRWTRGLFYSDCSEADAAYAQSRLVSEPAAPLMTPLKISDENFGRVPRVYIECLRDRVVPPTLQRKMQAALPCEHVFYLDADHSPFFSAAQALTARLKPS